MRCFPKISCFRCLLFGPRSSDSYDNSFAPSLLLPSFTNCRHRPHGHTKGLLFRFRGIYRNRPPKIAVRSSGQVVILCTYSVCPAESKHTQPPLGSMWRCFYGCPRSAMFWYQLPRYGGILLYTDMLYHVYECARLFKYDNHDTKEIRHRCRAGRIYKRTTLHKPECIF